MRLISIIVALNNAVFARTEKLFDFIDLSSIARLVFAGVLFVYYFHSGLGKLGGDSGYFLLPNAGAYAQIFPIYFENADYDTDNVAFLWRGAVVWIASYLEILLPVLIVIGLFTRASSLGMAFFILVQSYVDIFGHLVEAVDVGAWFDRFPSAILLDQRALWVFLMLFLIAKGGGRYSLDALLRTRGLDIR